MTKKEHFQNSALRLIHEKGFKAMTMRDLASEMSCDIKNLYNYTSSKDEILVELLNSISSDFHQGIQDISQSNLTASQQLKELIRLHVMLSFRQPLKVGLLINEYRNLKEPHHSAFLEKRNEYEARVTSILKFGIKQKEFRDFPVAIATQTILGSLRWQYDYYQKKKDLNPITIVEELTQMILPGLLTKTASNIGKRSK